MRLRSCQRLTCSALTLVMLGCGDSGGDQTTSSSTSATSTTGVGGTSPTSTSESTSTSASTSSSASTGSGGGPGCTGDEGPVFAISALDFGEGNSGQWKALGFDLDGVTSTAASTGLCQPSSGGSASAAYPDGDNGIDNSFGKNVLPLMLSLTPTWTSDTNAAIQSGDRTALARLSCLPSSGDLKPFSSQFFVATALGSAPKFDGTDQWPVAPEFLANPVDASSSIFRFDGSSVVGTLYDSGPNGTLALRVGQPGQGGSTMTLTLHDARVTMTLSSDRMSAIGGRVGGVLNTEELVAEVKKVAYGQGLCQQSFLPSLITQIRQASDILSDGTQDPNKTCDGISIGLGFEMKLAGLGSVGPALVEMGCP